MTPPLLIFLKILIPTLMGLILSLSFIQLIDSFHSDVQYVDQGHLDDTFIYILLVPVIIVALLFQFFVTLPIWNRTRNNGKLFGLKLISVACLLCILSSLFFTLIIWAPKFGIIDFIKSFLIALAFFIVYWAGNLLSLKLLDNLFNKTKILHQ